MHHHFRLRKHIIIYIFNRNHVKSRTYCTKIYTFIRNDRINAKQNGISIFFIHSISFEITASASITKIKLSIIVVYISYNYKSQFAS